MNPEKKIIMLVDDDPTGRSLGKMILGSDYTVYPIPSGEQLFKIMERVTPGLIMLDIEMPGMNGFEIIKQLKENAVTRNIPVIFLSAGSNPENEQEALRLGAGDFITKPVSPADLLQSVEKHLSVTYT